LRGLIRQRADEPGSQRGDDRQREGEFPSQTHDADTRAV
jgi:hypothetical protein